MQQFTTQGKILELLQIQFLSIALTPDLDVDYSMEVKMTKHKREQKPPSYRVKFFVQGAQNFSNQDEIKKAIEARMSAYLVDENHPEAIRFYLKVEVESPC